MTNEVYVAKKAEEAASHPKALLLVAIGAMCPTPANAAKEAELLGLSREEVQFARWLAVFKRPKTSAEFLQWVKAVVQREEKEKMEIKEGGWHRLAELKRMLQDALKVNDDKLQIHEWTWHGSAKGVVSYLEVDTFKLTESICKIENAQNGFNLCCLEKWFAEEIWIHLFQKKFFRQIKKMAENFQKKIGVKVAIFEQY